VGGYFPGPVGIATFVGIKFAGYALAALAIKKLEPTISASAPKIAAARTGLGIVLGIPCTLVGVMVTSELIRKAGESNLALYSVLFLVRVFVWAFLLFILTKRPEISLARLWSYAVAGAVWSSLLDWPAFKLAGIMPGQIPVC
jgi:hypothetical protein